MTEAEIEGLVERLRATFTVRDEFSTCHPLCNPDGPAAADLIASQRARIEALEGALRPFARQCPHKNEDGAHGILVPATVADVRNARALSERGA